MGYLYGPDSGTLLEAERGGKTIDKIVETDNDKGFRTRFKKGTDEFLNETEELAFYIYLFDHISKYKKVYVDGYASTEGGSNQNMRLSEKRAKKIADLIQQHLPEIEIVTVANGEVPGDLEENQCTIINTEFEYQYVWDNGYLEENSNTLPEVSSNREKSTQERRDMLKKMADGLKLRPKETGYGQTQRQMFTLTVKVEKSNFDRVRDQYALDPSVLNNNCMATYTPLGDNYDNGRNLKVGDQMQINISGPMNGFVRFTKVKVKENSFEIEATTLESCYFTNERGNHPDAGKIWFSGSYNPDSNIAKIDITNITKAGNMISYLSLPADLNLNIPRLLQKYQWRRVIDNIEQFMLGGVSFQPKAKKQVIVTEGYLDNSLYVDESYWK